MFDQFEELSHLIGFRFSLAVLDVHKFWNPRMLKNTMTAAGPRKLKSECLDQGDYVGEPDVLRSRKYLLQ